MLLTCMTLQVLMVLKQLLAESQQMHFKEAVF